MDEKLAAKIIALLSSHHVMTLATVRPDGFPQATPVNYLNDGLTIYFGTDATSQKAGNIRLNDKVSAAITGEADAAYKLSGVSLSGTAKRVTEIDRLHELRVRLFRRLPDVKRLANGERLAVYEITPVAISLIDYTSGYGKTFLLEL